MDVAKWPQKMNRIEKTKVLGSGVQKKRVFYFCQHKVFCSKEEDKLDWPGLQDPPWVATLRDPAPPEVFY